MAKKASQPGATERTRLLPAEAKLLGAPEPEKPWLSMVMLARLVTFASSFSEGWELATFSVTMIPITNEFNLSGPELAVVVGLPTLVTTTTGWVLGCVMDRIGRKPVILLSYGLCVAGCLLMASAASVPMLLAGRCVLVLGVKVSTTSVSVYMTELSPSLRRGTIVSLEQLFLNSGVMSLSIAAWLLMGHGVLGWRGFVALGTVAPGVSGVLVVYLSVPESPRCLHLQGRLREARSLLRRVLQDNEVEAEAILDSWQREKLEAEAEGDELRLLPARLRQIWQHKGSRISMACFLCRACSGISLVSLTFNLLLNKTMDPQDALGWYMIAMVFKILVLPLPCFWLIDEFGRRPLWIASALGCAFCTGAAAFLENLQLMDGGMHITFCLIGFFICYELGVGPVMWVYAYEILPPRRGLAGSVVQIPADLVTMLTMMVGVRAATENPTMLFVMVTCTNVFSAVFFWLCCPETNGSLLESVQDRLDVPEGAKEAARSPSPAPLT